MSTVMFENTDITVTRFAAGVGRTAYQVTWRSSDKEHLFDYVSFDSWEKAHAFSVLLAERLVR